MSALIMNTDNVHLSKTTFAQLRRGREVVGVDGGHTQGRTLETVFTSSVPHVDGFSVLNQDHKLSLTSTKLRLCLHITIKSLSMLQLPREDIVGK